MGVKTYDPQAGTYVRVDPKTRAFLDDELPEHVTEISTSPVISGETEGVTAGAGSVSDSKRRVRDNPQA